MSHGRWAACAPEKAKAAERCPAHLATIRGTDNWDNKLYYGLGCVPCRPIEHPQTKCRLVNPFARIDYYLSFLGSNVKRLY